LYSIIADIEHREFEERRCSKSKFTSLRATDCPSSRWFVSVVEGNNFQPALPTDCLIQKGILKTRHDPQGEDSYRNLRKEKTNYIDRRRCTFPRLEGGSEGEVTRHKFPAARNKGACIREIDVCASSSSDESRSSFGYSADEGWSQTDICYLLIITPQHDRWARRAGVRWQRRFRGLIFSLRFADVSFSHSIVPRSRRGNQRFSQRITECQGSTKKSIVRIRIPYDRVSSEKNCRAIKIGGTFMLIAESLACPRVQVFPERKLFLTTCDLAMHDVTH